jgi:glycosyltransferase involved in cell wall biosynthesis
MEIKVVFLGGARYSEPLDTTSEKKFRALKSLGELWIVGFSKGLSLRRFTEHAHFCLLPKLPLPILRYTEMFVLGVTVACWLIVRHGVQIIVAQSPYEGFAAATAKKITSWLGYQAVLIVENHGDFEQSLFLQRRILFPRIYAFLMHRFANFTLKQADIFRAVSNSTREQLERLHLDKPIFQFVAWTDIEPFLQCGAEVQKRSQEIVYAGVLIPRKGVHHLVSAFYQVLQNHRDARLILIGREENKNYAAGLKEQIKMAGLNSRVQFIGELSQVELSRHIQQASVFVLPSYSEGLPRVVFEAMAAGLPVIASVVSGIPDVVQDGVTGLLVPPGDEVALAEKMRWILEHPGDAEEMGARAHRFAQRFFSTEAYIDSYRQIIEAAEALIDDDVEHARSAI